MCREGNEMKILDDDFIRKGRLLVEEISHKIHPISFFSIHYSISFLYP